MKDAIRYIVTVEAVIERVEKVGKEWKPCGDEGSAKYAYTPEIEKTVQRNVNVLTQTVDRLDMRALVAVLNGLPAPVSE